MARRAPALLAILIALAVTFAQDQANFEDYCSTRCMAEYPAELCQQVCSSKGQQFQLTCLSTCQQAGGVLALCAFGCPVLERSRDDAADCFSNCTLSLSAEECAGACRIMDYFRAVDIAVKTGDTTEAMQIARQLGACASDADCASGDVCAQFGFCVPAPPPQQEQPQPRREAAEPGETIILEQNFSIRARTGVPVPLTLGRLLQVEQDLTRVTLTVSNAGVEPIDIEFKETIPVDDPARDVYFTTTPDRIEEGSITAVWMIRDLKPGAPKTFVYTIYREVRDPGLFNTSISQLLEIARDTERKVATPLVYAIFGLSRKKTEVFKTCIKGALCADPADCCGAECIDGGCLCSTNACITSGECCNGYCDEGSCRAAPHMSLFISAALGRPISSEVGCAGFVEECLPREGNCFVICNALTSFLLASAVGAGAVAWRRFAHPAAGIVGAFIPMALGLSIYPLVGIIAGILAVAMSLSIRVEPGLPAPPPQFPAQPPLPPE